MLWKTLIVIPKIEIVRWSTQESPSKFQIASCCPTERMHWVREVPVHRSSWTVCYENERTESKQHFISVTLVRISYKATTILARQVTKESEPFNIVLFSITHIKITESSRHQSCRKRYRSLSRTVRAPLNWRCLQRKSRNQSISYCSRRHRQPLYSTYWDLIPSTALHRKK